MRVPAVTPNLAFAGRPADKPVKVLVVDGLGSLFPYHRALELDPKLQVVGLTQDQLEFTTMLQATQPDVVVIGSTQGMLNVPLLWPFDVLIQAAKGPRGPARVPGVVVNGVSDAELAKQDALVDQVFAEYPGSFPHWNGLQRLMPFEMHGDDFVYAEKQLVQFKMQALQARDPEVKLRWAHSLASHFWGLTQAIHAVAPSQ